MTTVYRIEPRESASCEAGGETNFVTPEGVWDLTNFRIQFYASVTGGTANRCTLPRGTASLIEALVVYVDDTEVQNIRPYNQLAVSLAHANTEDRYDPQANPGYISTSVNNAIYTIAEQACSISSFNGILGSNAVIRGTLRVQIFWAPNTVLIRDNANAVYSLTGIHAVIACGNAAEVGHLEFDNWTSGLQRNQSYNQQTPVSIQSRQIDYALATFLVPDYDTALSTNALGGNSRHFVHGTGDLASNFSGTSVSFTADQIALSAGRIDYMHALGMLRMFIGPVADNEYPVALARNGVNEVRNERSLLAYDWNTGVPINIVGSDKTVTVSFNSTGTSGGVNVSLLFVKTTCRLEWDEANNTYTLIK